MARACPILLALFVLATSAQAAGITVEATRDGDALEVRASAEIPVSRDHAWEVLTDYDRYAGFVPDLDVSRVISREGDRAVVEQKGAARFLFFSYPIEVRLAVTEFPRTRIESRATAGNFRELTSTYELEAREGRVVLRYSGRMIPDFDLFPFFGTRVLRSSVADTFRALVEEIEHGREPQKP
jgi:ribosome-associated toxin RatA of RatAB toxin-antitoxin module